MPAKLISMCTLFCVTFTYQERSGMPQALSSCAPQQCTRIQLPKPSCRGRGRSVVWSWSGTCCLVLVRVSQGLVHGTQWTYLASGYTRRRGSRWRCCTEHLRAQGLLPASSDELVVRHCDPSSSGSTWPKGWAIATSECSRLSL